MQMQVEWSQPIPMRQSRALIYSYDLEKAPVAAGVYVFGRRYGDGFEALYVGQAENLRARLKTQMNNLRLMAHLRDAKSGSRVVVVGRVVTKRGQQIGKCLTLVERSLIRYYLSEGHDLVNKQGTLINRHEVVSSQVPMRIVPRRMYLESRG